MFGKKKWIVIVAVFYLFIYFLPGDQLAGPVHQMKYRGLTAENEKLQWVNQASLESAVAAQKAMANFHPQNSPVVFCGL